MRNMLDLRMNQGTGSSLPFFSLPFFSLSWCVPVTVSFRKLWNMQGAYAWGYINKGLSFSIISFSFCQLGWKHYSFFFSCFFQPIEMAPGRMQFRKIVYVVDEGRQRRGREMLGDTRWQRRKVRLFLLNCSSANCEVCKKTHEGKSTKISLPYFLSPFLNLDENITSFPLSSEFNASWTKKA